MDVPNASLLAAVVISGVHHGSAWLRRLRFTPRSQVLSAAGGMAVAFVLLQLLPSVARAQANLAGAAGVGQGARGRLLFLVMLVGLLAYFAVERSVRAGLATRPELHRRLFWLNVSSNAALEVTVGYLLVADRRAPLQLALFTIAMALRGLITDRGMHEAHQSDFDRYGRALLLTAAPLGWLLGVLAQFPPNAIGAVRALLAGGVVLHVLKEELPEDRESSYLAFFAGALSYAALLLVPLTRSRRDNAQSPVALHAGFGLPLQGCQ